MPGNVIPPALGSRRFRPLSSARGVQPDVWGVEDLQSLAGLQVPSQGMDEPGRRSGCAA